MSNISSTVANGYIRYYLNRSTEKYQNCLEQLSSGSKFTSIATDPVASAKSAAAAVEIDFNKIVTNNIANGSDLLSLTESYQESINNNISRIKDLTTQAASETCSTEDKAAILSEIKSRLDYINQTVDSANFNGHNILDGSSIDMTLKTGLGINDSINIGTALKDVSTDALDISLPGVTAANWDPSDYLTKLDTASNTMTSYIATTGSYEQRLGYATDKLSSMTENLTEYKSTISDTDTAEASADLIKYQILQDSAVSIFIQANDTAQYKYSLLKLNN